MEYGPHPALVVRASSTHGLGVFAKYSIRAGTVIERCAILESMVLRTPTRPRSDLDRYLFYNWEGYANIGYMPSGFGTMYNDAGRCCNVTHHLDMNNRCLTFVAVRDIEVDEELLMDYKQDSRPKIICGDDQTVGHGKEESTPKIDCCPTSTLDESAQGWCTR